MSDEHDPTQWTWRSRPPTTFPPGVYIENHAWLNIVTPRKVIGFASPAAWWEKGAADKAAREIAEALNLPLYRRRDDYRRIHPHSWELVTE